MLVPLLIAAGLFCLLTGLLWGTLIDSYLWRLHARIECRRPMLSRGAAYYVVPEAEYIELQLCKIHWAEARPAVPEGTGSVAPPDEDASQRPKLKA